MASDGIQGHPTLFEGDQWQRTVTHRNLGTFGEKDVGNT